MSKKKKKKNSQIWEVLSCCCYSIIEENNYEIQLKKIPRNVRIIKAVESQPSTLTCQIDLPLATPENFTDQLINQNKQKRARILAIISIHRR